MAQPERKLKAKTRNPWPEGAVRYVFERLAAGDSPPAIAKALTLQYGNDAPKVRAIQYWKKKIDPPDPSAPWKMMDAEPEDAALILPVLAAVVERTHGERTLTVSAAEWVVRLSRAGADDLDPWGLYRLARLYLQRGTEGTGTADLDVFVGLRAWREPERFQRFVRALEEGWVETPHAEKIFLTLTLQDICGETPRQKARRLYRELTGDEPRSETIAGLLPSDIVKEPEDDKA